jgi:methylmalonyl-CoA/ethylmalonyl-CoA epimerase
VLPSAPLDHVGIVVRDMDESVAAYRERLGPEVVAHVFDVEVDDVRYLGEPASFSARCGVIDDGGTRIELIQPLAGRSPYSDQLAERGEGPHHVAFVVPSLAEYLDGDVVLDGRTFAHLGGATGLVVEVIERAAV